MKKLFIAAAVIVLFAADFASALTEGKEYFLNTALHAVRKDEIFWVNYTDKSIHLRAGDKVKIVDISGHMIRFEHKNMIYNFAYTEKGSSGGEELYTKFFTDRNINSEIEGYPERIKSAINRGIAEKGMTKKQVLQAVGCPAIADARKTYNLTLKEIMEADKWIFYFNRFNRWQATFKDGLLVTIEN